MNSDTWDKLCYYLSEKIHGDITEKEFEPIVEKGLEILGWSEFAGDFAIRPSYQLGSTKKSLRPDFLIKSSETDEKLLVIEIKKPKTLFSLQNQTQLSTYMRQFKLPFGLLIGPQIQIFYDGQLNPEDNAVLIGNIEFKRGSKEGEMFVQLFSKEDFNLQELHDYAEEQLRLRNRAAEVIKLTRRITSSDFTSHVTELIKHDLAESFENDLIEEALQNVQIRLSTRVDNAMPDPVPVSANRKITEQTKKSNALHDSTRYILNGNGIHLAKNRFVLECVREYINRFPSDFKHLKEVFYDDLQGSTGVINSLDYVQNKYAHINRKRHFVKGSDILTSSDNVQFVVSTEWRFDNVQNIVRIAREMGFHVEEVKG
jgi:hypothetical protein